MGGKKTEVIFPDWQKLIEFMEHDRTTIWKALGYSSQNTYDAAMTRMKKSGKFDRKLQFAISVYEKIQSKKRK